MMTDQQDRKNARMKIVKRLFLFSIAAPVLVSCNSMSTGRELAPSEIRHLVVGKTVDEDVVSRGERSSTYYSPSGNLHCIVNGASEFYGSWDIKDNGELCVEFGGSRRCRVVVEEDGVYKKYKIRSDGSRKHVVTFEKFNDGDKNEFWEGTR